MNIFKRRERTERDRARADQMRELAQKLGRANALVNRLKAENAGLKASLSGVHEQLRQERAERRRDAELVTPAVLGSAMRRLEEMDR